MESLMERQGREKAVSALFFYPFKMAFDTNRISTQKIREIIEELTELGVYDSKTGMVSYDNDDKVLEQKIIAIRSHIVQKH